ncbi:hypothetical protein APR41_05945 [Salegentibacter salinarum]|uniref:Glycosyltransferase RgtA/B/C/D-like domain-containing protein n=1 Tax=Salegentibacter salinarum TaxID=447422 RepID=A0A2N0TQG5_9FLAO|nr:hypothetical protein [Salegentibacter salinarum]PKD16979.1 hypothetical protein APR41_05945 [Salegentibacter salinarum]SKB53283.1 hypothetical protein SAMN05660903_01212 [Salegentibacter salinarum]
MYLEPYLLTGPLRIILLFVLILLIHRIVSTRISAQSALNFLVPTITLVMAAVLLGSFILILIGIFDLFVIISIIIGLAILAFMNLNFNQPLKTQLRKIYTRSLLYITIKLEKGQKFLDRDNIIKPKHKHPEHGLSQYHRNWQLAIGLLLPVLTYISRSSLFQEDVYTLSSSWFSKLNFINGISAHTWFFQTGEMMGDYLLINLYAKLTHITNAQALQSFGLLESALLSLIIYWLVFKISRKQAPGIFAGLSFALFYAFLPINIDLIAEHKSVFTSLIIALPTMYFCIYPQSFSFNRKAKFYWLLTLFTAILLLDLFVGVLLVFPYLLILFIFKFRKNFRQITQIFLAYFFSVAFIGIIYGAAALLTKEDFGAFILSNFYSFDTYTYNPHLVAPFRDLMNYYQIAAVVFLLIIIYNYIKKSQKWLASLVFLSFINLMIGIYQLDTGLVDLDILSQVLCIFIPIFFGIIVNVMVNLFSVFNFSPKVGTRLEVVIGTIIIAVLTISTFPRVATLNFKENKTENMVFEAYSKIQSGNLPYSYAVVNALPYFSFSKNSHYYYNYDYFNNTYIERDRRFNRYKDNLQYLQNNQDIILPETMFVFVYKQIQESNQGKKAVVEKQRDLTLERIELLKLKGRNVDVYYEDRNLEVYQIENRERASNINQLLF